MSNDMKVIKDLAKITEKEFKEISEDEIKERMDKFSK